MLGGSQAGYARMTRRWWYPVRKSMEEQGLGDRPVYFVSSNPHSMVNLVTPTARSGEAEIVRFIEEHGPEYLREELERFRDGRAEGSWENFLYFGARLFWESLPEDGEEWRGGRRTSGRSASRTSPRARRCGSPRRSSRWTSSTRRGSIRGWARSTPSRLARSTAVVVNIEYPLGLAAYNILREVTVSTDVVKGVYVLGKAATLNADVGDVLISGVIHDEHSGSTYWLDNAFSFDDIAPFLRFGSGLDNQRAVTVKWTFLQNREYLDFYYREAYTVVEMEAGPFCNAVYEIADADRYPVGEAVNFSKLPIDFGIIHYASDTPYTQARTLGARGLSYYGMDSTYASSLAIMRRDLQARGRSSRARARRASQQRPHLVV